MAQEFTINSSAIESKINQLLPSQGGFGAGVDFSASTMVIPIVDLTETAEGSDVRVDLQTSFSHQSANTFTVANATTTLLTTTGYYRFFGLAGLYTVSATGTALIRITDGTTNKDIFFLQSISGSPASTVIKEFDFNVFLRAGDSVVASSTSSLHRIVGTFRQIADVNGNLTDP